MYEKTDKRRLYWLMDAYLSGKINAEFFCNEYYYCYCLELNTDTLTTSEQKEFSELDTISGRFSENEKDSQQWRGAFYTEKELRPKVIAAQKQLKKEQVDLIATFEPNDKRKLYWLVSQYLLQNINTQTFCNEFVNHYNALDTDLLTKSEYKIFAALNPIAGSFSKFKNDFKPLTTTDHTENELRKKTQETKELLNKALSDF